MQSNRAVSIVIPSWNSEKQLRQNLPSVFKAAGAVGAEVIVVDDASSDHTVAYLKSLGSRIHLFTNPTNLGFAHTVNRGVDRAQGDIVILLNTDVRPSPDCFTHLVKSFQDTKLFAVTFNSDNSWAGGWWRGGLLEHAAIHATATNQAKLNPSLWASGGQAAFDRRKWVILGGLDPIYAPFYWEDVDLGYRAWKHGWCIVWDPAAQVIHDHISSVIRSNYTKKYISNVAMRNQLLFIWKNIHDSNLWSTHLAELPRLIKNYPSSFFQALLRLPKALRSRIREKRTSVMGDLSVLAHWK